VENNIDKITDLTEKKPTQALIYALLLAISVLAGVIVWQNNKLGNKDEEKLNAVQVERTANFKEIDYWRKNSEFWSKKYDDCNVLVLTRTDANATRDQQKLDFYEEGLKRSIAAKKKNAVSIQKISETIPTVKTPTINPTNQNNEN